MAVTKDGYFFTPREVLVPIFRTRNGCVGEVRHYPTQFDGIEQEIYCMAEGSCALAWMKGRGTPGTRPLFNRHNATSAVVRCTWAGEHGWPVGRITPDFAMQIIWSFFTTHRRGGTHTAGQGAVAGMLGAV